MRRFSNSALLLLVLGSGCARGSQTLVQAFRTSVPATARPVSPPSRNPNELTARERELLQGKNSPAREPSTNILSGSASSNRATVPVSQSELRWRQDYESPNRRPIETLRFGAGEQRILITSSLHGNETDTVRALEAALGELPADDPALENRAVLAIRTPNPDGAADRTMTNSRGVDLNRNWPSPYFPANPTRITGEAPASEPETRVLIQILADFRPTRIVHVTSGGSLRGAVVANYDAQVVDGFDLIRIDQVKAATIEDYGATRLKSEVVNVVLPAPRGKAIDEASVRQIILMLTDRTPSPPATSGIASTPAETSPSNPIRLNDEVQPSAAPQEQPRPDGVKGFVQFLPEPPGLRALQTNDGGARYFELPPPPE